MIPITIERHFLDLSKSGEPVNQDIANILYDINVAAKLIRQQVTKGGLIDQHMLGSSGVINSSGEDVQALDLL